MIHIWYSPNSLDNIKPIVGESVPGISFLSQNHAIYSHSKKNIFIQSPLSCVSYTNKDWIHFDISIEEQKHMNFINSLQKLMLTIHKNTQKKYTKNIIWDYSIITKSSTTKSIHARIMKGCQVYDINHNKQNNTKLFEKSIADFIFSVSQIRIVKSMDEEHTLYGKILFEIVQIRSHNTKPIPNTCLFESVHSKYFDMLQKGVPRQAVEQKMISEGIDTSILDNKHNTTLCTSSYSKQKLSFCANDLKNAKLRKVTPNNKKKTRPKLGIHLGISYDDIQNRLKSLRKTRIISLYE